MIARASYEPPTRSQPTSVSWAGAALLLACVVGVVSKTAGVLVAPGLRGVAAQRVVEWVETASATLAYVFTALLVALVCGGSFELARARRVPLPARGSVVAISGLVVALVSPAVVMRLHAFAAIALAVVTSIVVMVAGIVAARAAHTRALGAVLTMLALGGLLRPIAWEVSALASERASLGYFHAARALATGAVVVQALATLVAAAWLGTRSRWRGRVLANGAVIAAFIITYLAARETDGPQSAPFAVLRAALGQAAASSVPSAIGAIAAFLLPASVLLAAVTLVQAAQPKAVLAALSLALLSQGSFDVPLQALAVVAASQWALLAMADERAVWAALVESRGKAAATPGTPPLRANANANASANVDASAREGDEA